MCKAICGLRNSMEAAAAAKGSDSAEAHSSDYRSAHWLLPRQLKWDSARSSAGITHWQSPFSPSKRWRLPLGRTLQVSRIARADKKKFLVGRRSNNKGTARTQMIMHSLHVRRTWSGREIISPPLLLPRAFYFPLFYYTNSVTKCSACSFSLIAPRTTPTEKWRERGASREKLMQCTTVICSFLVPAL